MKRLKLDKFKAGGLDCLALVPEHTDKFPLLVLLHGFTETGRKYVELAGDLSGGDYGIILPDAPVTTSGLTRSWFTIDPTFSCFAGYVAEARPRFNRMMNDILARYKTEAGQVAVSGFSIGGMMALDGGLRYRGPKGESLAGLISFSAMLPDDESGDPVELQQTLAAAVRDNIPVFIGHGANDPMIPPRLGRATRELLEKAGVAVEYYSFLGFHEIIPDEVLKVREFLSRAFEAKQAVK